MNRILKKILILTLSISLQASTANNKNSFKIRAAAFIPTSKLFREIYKTAGACTELEYAYRFRDHLEIWGNFDWFSRHGKSVGLNNPTKINIANFSFGFKFPYNVNSVHELYLGVGSSIAGIWINNKSCCCCEKVSKAAGAIIFKSGYYYYFSEQAFIDLFADYLYQPAHFQRHIDIGGLRLGIGIGVMF